MPLVLKYSLYINVWLYRRVVPGSVRAHRAHWVWGCSGSWVTLQRCSEAVLECRSSRKAPTPFALYNKFLLFHTHCSPGIIQYSVSLVVPVVMLFVRQRFVWNFCSNISAVVVHYFWQHWLPVNLPSCFSNWSYSTPDKTWQRDSRKAVAVTSFSFHLALCLSKNFQSVIMKHRRKSC